MSALSYTNYRLVDCIRDVCKKFGDYSAIASYRPDSEYFKYFTYRELADSSQTVYEILLKCSTKNFSREKHRCVGVLLDPNGSFPAIVLGIMIAGHPFVCFDVMNFSKERVDNLLTYLKIGFIITTKKYCHLLLEISLIKYVRFDSFKILDDVIEIWHIERSAMDVCANKNDFKSGSCQEKETVEEYLYAIQTSGSTGEPKIVRVPEKCILPNVSHLRQLFGITSSDGLYFSSPVTFDPSMIELFLSLTSGATLFIIPSRMKAASCDVLQILFGNEIKKMKTSVTFIQTTPSLFLSWPKKFVKENIMNDNNQLRVLALGGECCPAWEVIKRYRSENNNTFVYSLYGITEVSCWASINLLKSADDGSDLGDPLMETVLEVRRDDGKVVVGEGIGEMFIGSSSRYCLLNDETFKSLTFPVFRSTGDIVKVMSSRFYFLGRKDKVTKRFGHRVCLSQIERLALSSEQIDWCSCVMDKTYGLILFVLIADCNKTNDTSYSNKLRSMLKKNLTPASVPDHILVVDSLHLNSHGKVDVSFLQSIISQKIEKVNVKILESCSRTDNFLLLKYDELWKKYTYSESVGNYKELNDVLSSNLSSNSAGTSYSLTDANSTQGSKKEFGFLSAGGSSMSAIQFVSELSLYTMVPNVFIGKLLSDYLFSDCFKILMGENIKEDNVIATIQPSSFVKRKSSEVVHVGDFPENFSDDVKVNVHSDIIDVSDEFTEKIKRKKLKKDSNVSFMKCRGKTVLFSQCKSDTVTEDNHGYNLPNIQKFNLNLKWKYYLRKCVDASPTIIKYESGETLVLIGSHSGHFAVLNLSDGKLISECILPDRIESSALVSKCGRYYYVGCYDGKLYCIEINSGNVLWNVATLDMVKSTPIFGSGFSIIFGSYDKILYCVSCETGKEIWRHKGGGSYYSVPSLTVCGKVLAASLDGVCSALSSDKGVVLWSYKVEAPVFASPLLCGSNVIFAEVTGILSCLDINSGVLVWKFSASGNIFSSLTFCEKDNDHLVLFGCHDHHVYCLTVTDGPKMLWKALFESPIFATPFISNQGDLSIVAVCTTKGVVHVLDLSDGSSITSMKLSNEIFSSPVIDAGHVIFGCRDDYVYCLQLD